MPVRALADLASDCRQAQRLPFCPLAMVVEFETAAAVLDCTALATGDEAACGKAAYLLERASEVRRSGVFCASQPCRVLARRFAHP